MGGLVPFGYLLQDRTLVIDEAEAEIVRLICGGGSDGHSPTGTQG